jgi:glutathione S-transferase
MPHLTLCCFPGACSRATMIALEEAGAAYDTRVANLPKGEQRSADYLAINPKGKVPVLVIDGKPLTENVAILAWLADAFPKAGLLPADPMQRAEALSAVAWLASSVLTTMARIVRPERVSAEPAAAEGIKAKAIESIAADLAIAEKHMAGRSWWLGGWSVADAYLYYIFAAVTQRGIDRSAYPNLAAHAARMEQRPSVQKVLSWEERAKAALAA